MNGRACKPLCLCVSVVVCDRTTEAQRHREEFKEVDQYE